MLWCALALLGCAGAAPQPVVEPPVEPAVEPAGEPAAPRSQVWLLPRFDQMFSIAGDGRTRLVVGSTRVELEGARVAWPDDRFATPIAAAAPVEGGWVFVATDGMAVRSKSFLGPLERLGEVPFDVAALGPQYGRLAVIDLRGRVWSTIGAEPIARMLTPEGRVIDIAFADARRGALILDGGALYSTDDGGASWQPIASSGAAALSVWPGAIQVSELAGPRMLFGIQPAAPTIERQTLIDAYHARFDRALRLTHARRTGAREYYDVQGPTARRLEWDTGAELERRDVFPDDGCDVLPWGSALAARCPGGALFRAATGLDFEPIERDGTTASLRFSDDGVHAARKDHCKTDPTAPKPNTRYLCARVASGKWRSIEIADGEWWIGPMHGGRALLYQFGAGSDLLLLDLDTGTTTTVPLPDTGGKAAYQASDWADDGTLAVLVDWVNGDRHALTELLIMAPDGSTTMHRVAEWAKHVGLADARRVVIAGSEVDQLARSLDGGATFAPIPLPIDGAPARIQLGLDDYARRSGPAVQCSADGCAIGDRVAIERWDDFEPSQATHFVAARPRDPRFERQSAPAAVLLACTVEPGTPTRVRVPRRPRGVPRSAAAELLVGPGGQSWRWRFGAGAATRDVLSWRPEGGRIQRIAGPVVLEPVAPGSPAAEAAPEVLVLSDAGILLRRCARTCALDWIPTSRSQAVRVASSARNLVEAVPTSDGGALVAIRGRGAPSRDRLIRVARDGATVDRWFAWADRDTWRALGRWNGVTGYAVADRMDQAWLQFYPLQRDMQGPAESVPRLMFTYGVRPCATPAPNPPLALWVEASGALPLTDERGQASRPDQAYALIVESPTGLCMTSYRLAWSDTGSTALIEASGPEISGVLTDAREARAITCARPR